MVFECFEAGQFDQCVAPGRALVGENHFLDELVQAGLWRPAEFFARFAGVAEQGFDFAGAEVARVDPGDDVAKLGFGLLALDLGHDADLVHALAFKTDTDARFGSGGFDELANAVLHAGGDDEVFGMVLLHQPLHFDVVAGVAPVAQGAHVAEVEASPAGRGRCGRRRGCSCR